MYLIEKSIYVVCTSSYTKIANLNCLSSYFYPGLILSENSRLESFICCGYGIKNRLVLGNCLVTVHNDSFVKFLACNLQRNSEILCYV